MSVANDAASDAADVIIAAAKAYVDGDSDGVRGYLHDDVRLLGSEQGEDWSGVDAVMTGLGLELKRLAAGHQGLRGGGKADGVLVRKAKSVPNEEVQVIGDIAWWSFTGQMDLDERYHHKTSWTVVLNRVGEDWKIRHSHFSIQR